MGRFLCKSIRKNDYVLSVDHNWYDYWINSKNTVPSTYTGNIFEPIQWDAPVVPGVDLGHERAQGKMTGWSALDTLTLANDKLLLTVGVHGHRAQVRNYNVSGCLTPKNPKSLTGLIFLRKFMFFVLRNSVIYSIIEV